MPSLPADFWKDEEDGLLPITKQFLEAAVEGGIAEAAVGLEVDFSIVNAAVKQWVSGYNLQLVKGITETSQKVLGSALETWIGSGEPLSSLVNTLKPWYGKSRAQMIASTEVTRAYAQGNLEVWKHEDDIVGVKWQTAEDELVCPICGPLADSEVKKSQTFTDGLAHPPAHVRCRCWIIPITSEVEIDGPGFSPITLDGLYNQRIWGEEKFDGWYKGLTQEEKDALRAYKHKYDQEINSTLRGMNRPREVGTDEEVNNLIFHLKSSLSQTSIPEDVITYRGFRSPSLSKALKEGNGITHFDDPAFLSMSLSEHIARVFVDLNSEDDFVAEIHLPKGSPAAYIDFKAVRSGTGVQNEVEVLMSPGSKFKVTEKDRDQHGIRRLVLELLLPGEKAFIKKSQHQSASRGRRFTWIEGEVHFYG